MLGHLMLERLRELIARDMQVTIFADRGFADVKLYALLKQLDFEYVVRFRVGVLVTSAEGEYPSGGRRVGVIEDGRVLCSAESASQGVSWTTGWS